MAKDESGSIIQLEWEKARARKLSEPVTCITYRGRGHDSRPDKALHIIRRGDYVAFVGDRGTRGPAILKEEHDGEASVKRFKTSAFFNLKNAGFPQSQTEFTVSTFEQGWDLWESCFKGHHDRSLLAKQVFMRLCGADESMPFSASEAAPSKPKNPYEGNPHFGLI